MPLIPALRRQRQAGLCELEARLVYKTRSRTIRAVIQQNLALKNKQNSFLSAASLVSLVHVTHRLESQVKREPQLRRCLGQIAYKQCCRAFS